MFKNVYTSLWRPALVCLAGASSATTSTVLADLDEECGVHFQPDERLMNWSSTHSSNVRKLYEPCDDIEVKRLLEHHSVKKTKLRPVGTALSPNVPTCFITICLPSLFFLTITVNCFVH